MVSKNTRERKRKERACKKKALRLIESPEFENETDEFVRLITLGRVGDYNLKRMGELFFESVRGRLRVDVESGQLLVRGSFRDEYWNELDSFVPLYREWFRQSLRSRDLSLSSTKGWFSSACIASVERRARDRLFEAEVRKGLVVEDDAPLAVPALWR